MSGNRSGEIIAFGDIRCAGFKDEHGAVHAGQFIPENTDANGKLVASMWKGKFLLNRPDYVDGAGNTVKGKVESIWITVWSQKGAGPKGLAEIFAKTVSVGKSMSFDSLRLNTFTKTMYRGGAVVTDAQGNVISYTATGYTLNGNFRYGDDSAKQIANEINAYNGQASFQGRPQFWNVPGHAENTAWKNELQVRMNHAYDGQAPTYGYAKVTIPQGVTLVNQAGNAGLAGSAPTQAAPMVAPTAQPLS